MRRRRQRGIDGCRLHPAVAWLLVWACITGCNGTSATVSGTVTLDGEPVEGSPELYGTVSFYREDGSGAPAVGIIKSAGSYTLATGSQQRLEPGKYNVAVSVKKIHPPAEPGGLTRPERVSPEKYSKPATSGLAREVKPGNNTFDFALSSQPNE